MLILLLVLTVILWLICMWYAIRFMQLGIISKRQSRETRQTDLPSISIILCCKNQLSTLQENLPLLLNQEYPVDFEVIVVDMQSSDNSSKWLEYIKEEYPNLHYTLCPSSARDISLQRLALTLGVRASQFEWLLFMHPDAKVPNNHWLCHMASSCSKNVDAVQGFVRYATQNNWNERNQQFFRLWQQMLWMPYAIHHRPYRADGSCLCYRRSIFMNHHGFASSSSLLEGAESLLVNHNIKRNRCTINVSPQAILTQPQPSPEQWEIEQTFYMETRRHKKHTIGYRLLYCGSVMSYIFFPLFAIITFGFNLLYNKVLPQDNNNSIYWITLIAIPSMWIILFVTQLLSYRRTACQLGIARIPFTLQLRLGLIPLWDISAWFRWKFTDKRTFRKKFI